jgi:predicted RNA-binding Zn-ribbon protein involved in translation (DUF1610 family)
VREIACQCRACLRPWLAFTEAYAVYLCPFCGALLPSQRVRSRGGEKTHC